LFFCVCVDANDNELAYLEAIHFFVEVLDQFFGNVCELDLVFNFYKVRATGNALRGMNRGWREIGVS
jgi:AP-2 complex subunit sigma-1